MRIVMPFEESIDGDHFRMTFLTGRHTFIESRSACIFPDDDICEAISMIVASCLVIRSLVCNVNDLSRKMI